MPDLVIPNADSGDPVDLDRLIAMYLAGSIPVSQKAKDIIAAGIKTAPAGMTDTETRAWLTALGLTTPGGTRRQIISQLAWTGSSSDWSSILTLTETAVPANTPMRLTGSVVVARAEGSSNILGVVARRKFGTNNYAAIEGTGDYNRLTQRQYAQGSAWLDWQVEVVGIDFRFISPSTAQDVKVNVACGALDQGTNLTLAAEGLWLNRAQNGGANNWPGSEGSYVSWLELSYHKANGTITTETTTSRDSA